MENEINNKTSFYNSIENFVKKNKKKRYCYLNCDNFLFISNNFISLLSRKPK